MDLNLMILIRFSSLPGRSWKKNGADLFTIKRTMYTAIISGDKMMIANKATTKSNALFKNPVYQLIFLHNNSAAKLLSH